MKTIKDVIETYPDGWPIKKTSLYWNAFCWNAPYEKVDFCNQEDNLVNGCYLICTREEYEQALKESKMESKCDWYDYDKQKPIDGMQPPVDSWCECFYPDGDGWRKCKYIGLNTVSETKVYAVVFVPHEEPELSEYHNYKINYGDFKFRPLDHDKHQVKTVSLDWLVGSGIDAEFINEGVECWIGKLFDVSDKKYIDNNGGESYQCRPRMNHLMVLTKSQYLSIPIDAFDIEMFHKPVNIGGYENGFYIVTFKGLKDGYKYEWEA